MTDSYQAKRTSSYPSRISAYLEDKATLYVMGCEERPLSGSLALLCSAKAPASVLLIVHDLAQQWRQAETPIISGFQSPVEREALLVLLRPPGRAVLCLARGLPQRRKPEWQPALAERRLTILSPFAAGVKRGTKEMAIYRNRVVAALADSVLVAYAHPGSSTEMVAREALAWGKPVYTLDHTVNEGLMRMGIRPYGK